LREQYYRIRERQVINSIFIQKIETRENRLADVKEFGDWTINNPRTITPNAEFQYRELNIGQLLSNLAQNRHGRLTMQESTLSW